MAIDQHPSRPLISLVPIRPTLPLVFRDMGIIVTIPTVFQANHKPCLEQAFFKNTIIFFVVLPKFCLSIVFSFTWHLQSPQEKLKLMLMQILGDNKKCYGIFEKGLQVQVGPKMERMFSHRNKLKFNTFGASSFYGGNNFKPC